MMYKVALPIHLKENTDPQEVLRTLNAVHAEYAILAFDHVILSAKREEYEKMLSSVKDILPFLKAHGYKVGIWFWSLWLADIEHDELLHEVMLGSQGVLRIRDTALNSQEKRHSGFLCPTSPKIEIMLDIIRHAASYAPDLILMNDDLGYATYLSSIGCYCDRHMALIGEKLGYPITREELHAAVSGGKRNEIRDAWLEIQGQTLENYAAQIREAIDGVDASIRCGFCCVMSNFSTDGTSVARIAKLMAGKTKPLVRLIGAPYWAVDRSWGNRLQHVVELTRMECAWMQDDGIELIAEGDVYPRPRHRVPAAFLESYDTALRAAGCCDGIFKLMLDYTSSIAYESGYVSRHVRNEALYAQIERLFGDKTALGVRVYEYMNKTNDADLSGIAKPDAYASDLLFSHAARLLSDNSVPTVYTGGGVGIAFGENARHLPIEALENGLILDIRAARILMERGIDVGIEKIGRSMQNNFLYFPKEDERILAHYGENAAYEIAPKDGARIVTYSLDGDERYADTVEYENKDGQRFLVYAFDAAFTDENRYRNYATQRLLFDSLEWLGRQKMPVSCLGNPDLYMLCKKSEDALAIGLFNMFADDIPEPTVLLAEEYHDIEAVNCEATLDGRNVRLSAIPPYGYAFILLKKEKA